MMKKPEPKKMFDMDMIKQHMQDKGVEAIDKFKEEHPNVVFEDDIGESFKLVIVNQDLLRKMLLSMMSGLEKDKMPQIS